MSRVRLALLALTVSGLLAVAAALPMGAGSQQPPSTHADDGFAPLQIPLHQVPPEVVASLQRGEVSAATIFGPDDRIRVTETTRGPWRSIAQLVIFDQWNEIVSTCTGAMLNTNVVLTAAHCLFDPQTQSYAHSLLVIPGEDGLAFPFGAALAERFSVPQGWARSGDMVFDFGLAFISGTPFTQALGPFLPVAAVPDSYFYDPATIIATAGYPGDKPPGTQWFTAGFFFFVNAEAILTEMDAFPGQSGSPIYTFNEPRDELFIVGVFSRESARSNFAVRFSASHIGALVSYCASFGCSIQTRLLTDGPGPSPTAVRTATATSTSTGQPTKTPTPTRTPSPTPVATPSPTSPPRVIVPLVAADR
ncbi:hypothetical protein EDM76_00770 [bacterium]|nr:MAG: hypothetical protein EDM76_00770 [bacterium]MCL4230506.1 trypsin-like serine protease [Dehalococcoidia bacterium]